jgi:hypothetical protein
VEGKCGSLRYAKGCGFAYLCTDSVDEAIAWLKQHGILRGGFASTSTRCISAGTITRCS